MFVIPVIIAECVCCGKVTTMPISSCRKGYSGRIQSITGNDDTEKHLKDLGFTEGTAVTVVSRLFGSIIVDVRGSRIALDETMANRIIIG